MIRYSVRLADPDRHHFIVECRLDDAAPEQALTLPSWIPGSYLLREFARHVVALEASDGQVPVALEQTAKGTWIARSAGGALALTATIYGYDQSVRGAYFDRTRAFFNGTCLFFEPEGRGDEPVELVIERPTHSDSRAWRVATAMTAVAVDADGFGTYRADNYDELIDHPFEIGTHEQVEFDVAGVPHCFAVAGRIDTDLDRVASDLTQLCMAQIDFFGRPPPFDRYLFLGLAVGTGYGGLEHRASSSLIFRRDDLPKPGAADIVRDYQRFLGLASHEYFHSWHIKRSKPAAFMPYRLDRRNHTRLLWVFEGITSYYQELFLIRSGLLDADAFLHRLGELLTRVYRVPGRFRQSLADSSFNAWDHLYKPDPDSINRGVSYYSKGALVALALDLTLRLASSSARSLDDVVHALWRRFGADNVGLPEDGFEALAIEFGGDALADFFDAAVRGTDDIDLESLLADFGVKFSLRQAEGPKDSGGTPATSSSLRLDLGASFDPAGPGLKLASVLESGPAQAAGLAPGDIIVAVDRYRVAADNLSERLARYDDGDEVGISFFRNDVLNDTTLELAAARKDTAVLELDTGADGAASARREAWLGDSA